MSAELVVPIIVLSFGLGYWTKDYLIWRKVKKGWPKFPNGRKGT